LDKLTVFFGKQRVMTQYEHLRDVRQGENIVLTNAAEGGRGVAYTSRALPEFLAAE
jgi:hypothetical protein